MPQTRVKHSGTSDTHIVLAGTDAEHLVEAKRMLGNAENWLKTAANAESCHAVHNPLDRAIRCLHFAYANLINAKNHTPDWMATQYIRLNKWAESIHDKFDRECVR